MELNFIERFLILAHHPKKGRYLVDGTFLNYSIIASALFQMAQNDLVEFVNHKILVKKDGYTDNFFVNELFAQIQKRKSPKRIKYWINKFANKADRYRRYLIVQLSENGIFRIEYRKFIGLIPYRKSFMSNQTVRQIIIDDLREIVLEGKKVDRVSFALLSLVEACHLHRLISNNKQELKRVKLNLKALVYENPIASDLTNTIKDLQIVLMSIIIPAGISRV